MGKSYDYEQDCNCGCHGCHGEALESDEERPEQPVGREVEWMVRRLIRARTLLISGTITERLVKEVTTQLIVMQEEDENAPITVFINSAGGSADSGFAIYDLLRFVKPPVRTVVTGLCASAAVLIYLAAERKRRFALPNARFLLHQPSTMLFGPAVDIVINAEEIAKLRERYNQIVAKETGKTLEQINKDADRDFWLSAQQALEYGLVGEIIERYAEMER